MTILLSTLAVAFAAFCVWLTVRVVNRKERWAKWTLAGVVVVLVVYPLSYGPACWWLPQPQPVWLRPICWYLWRPMGLLAASGPKPIKRAIIWWAGFGQPKPVFASPPAGTSPPGREMRTDE